MKSNFKMHTQLLCEKYQDFSISISLIRSKIETHGVLQKSKNVEKSSLRKTVLKYIKRSNVYLYTKFKFW